MALPAPYLCYLLSQGYKSDYHRTVGQFKTELRAKCAFPQSHISAVVIDPKVQ